MPRPRSFAPPAMSRMSGPADERHRVCSIAGKSNRLLDAALAGCLPDCPSRSWMRRILTADDQELCPGSSCEHCRGNGEEVSVPLERVESADDRDDGFRLIGSKEVKHRASGFDRIHIRARDLRVEHLDLPSPPASKHRRREGADADDPRAATPDQPRLPAVTAHVVLEPEHGQWGSDGRQDRSGRRLDAVCMDNSTARRAERSAQPPGSRQHIGVCVGLWGSPRREVRPTATRPRVGHPPGRPPWKYMLGRAARVAMRGSVPNLRNGHARTRTRPARRTPSWSRCRGTSATGAGSMRSA